MGLRSYSDIPALKALEHWFDSEASFQNDTQKEAYLEPIFEKAKTSQARRGRRELERRASVPRETKNSGGPAEFRVNSPRLPSPTPA